MTQVALLPVGVRKVESLDLWSPRLRVAGSAIFGTQVARTRAQAKLARSPCKTDEARCGKSDVNKTWLSKCWKQCVLNKWNRVAPQMAELDSYAKVRDATYALNDGHN